jgi:anti-anti-sigma factor
LNRLVTELRATVVCAYRQASFDTKVVVGAVCVHPLCFGNAVRPQFRFAAGEAGSWQLSGEVDVAVLSVFAAALVAVAHTPCVVDVSELQFIDVGGMRTIAQLAREANVRVQLRGASRALRRHWQIAGFDRLAPTVEIVA